MQSGLLIPFFSVVCFQCVGIILGRSMIFGHNGNNVSGATESKTQPSSKVKSNDDLVKRQTEKNGVFQLLIISKVEKIAYSTGERASIRDAMRFISPPFGWLFVDFSVLSISSDDKFPFSF